MNVLIQNNSDTPIYFPINIPGKTSYERTVNLPDHQVTSVSEEIYFKYILPHPFFKSKFEDGTLRALNGEDASEANANNQMTEDLAYGKYLELMKKITDLGGLACKDIKPYLNADGTPNANLLQANFGRNVDPQVAERFRFRYVAEIKEGYHENVLKLPGGMKIETPASDVDIEKELEDMTDEELQAKATTMGIRFSPELERDKLIKRIRKHEE